MSTEGARAYRDLQRLARATGRGTQELLELYVHERFLARLARSRYRDRFVLKGGMLLAALDARRPTRDADLLARALGSEAEAMEATTAEIASIDAFDDGVAFDLAGIRSETIREEGARGGLRIKMPVALATAELRLQLDISVGDPVEPVSIDYAALLGGSFTLLGYSIEQTLAEKVATMVSRGDANTRDRDWADVYLLAGRHEIPAATLADALEATAAHRGHELRPLCDVIRILPDLRQEPWGAFRERSGLEDRTPEAFREVVDAVTAFTDPILSGLRRGGWEPRAWEWRA